MLNHPLQKGMLYQLHLLVEILWIVLKLVLENSFFLLSHHKWNNEEPISKTSTFTYGISLRRELSCQIHDEAKKFAYQTSVRVVVSYGGAPINQQMIRYLDLDKADQMLDIDLKHQITKIVQQMDMPPPGVRQTMLFSATFPRVIQATDKRSHLMDLLHAQRANGAHGKEREYTIRSFKSGNTSILVATDVAGRGLDILHVAHVVNFDIPNDIDDYVHHIGITGREGKSGLATTFFDENNSSVARALADLIQEANQKVSVTF